LPADYERIIGGKGGKPVSKKEFVKIVKIGGRS
jgi:hypothetical protein